MKKNHLIVAGATLASAAAIATPALAHTGVGETSGLLAGMLHPLLGLDHLGALLAVGLWAGMAQTGRARLVAPLGFVAAMLAGAVLYFAGVALPLVEPVIAASVLVLGVTAAVGMRAPLLAVAPMVACFALFHGQAHGAEAVGLAGPYLAGFALTSLLVQCAGMGLGAMIAKRRIARAAAVS